MASEKGLLAEESQEEKQHKSLVSAKKQTTTGSKVAPPAMADLLGGEWASDFEKDVTSMIMGLSAGAFGATPFGDSVQKISYIIEHQMMPKVLSAHNFTEWKLNDLWGKLEKCESDRIYRLNDPEEGSNAMQEMYTTESEQNKACREEEAALYATNVKCHEDWRVAKDEMKMKCELYEAKQEELGEATNNKAIVEKAPEEDVHTYIERISATICGDTAASCAHCIIEDGACVVAGTGEAETGESESPGESESSGETPDPGGDCEDEGVGFLEQLECHKKS